MAIGTYAELQTAIATWLHRDDLTALIPDFITLAESKLNRKLRLKAVDTVSSQQTSTTVNTLAFPSAMIELLSIGIDDGEGYFERLTFISPDQFYPLINPVAGKPEFYTVRDQIEFNCVSDQVYDLELHVLSGLTLSNGSPTNWLLTNHPDAYLFGALTEAAPYLKDDARFPMWAARLESAINEINAKEARSKTGPLVTDIPKSTYDGMFNITRGE